MFIHHLFAQSLPLPQMGAYLYEYVIAQNGVFVRAARPGLEALIWVAATADPIRGLVEVQPYIRLNQTVPAKMIEYIARRALDTPNLESLFYLVPGAAPIHWRLCVPDQVQAPASVRPADPFSPAASAALVEIHSHGNMPPFFSGADDRDETGFRIYAVIGNLKTRPAIAVRVGIYGHVWGIPANWAMDLPYWIQDAVYPDREYTIHEYTIQQESVYADRYSGSLAAA